jgi:hypothetical protein
MKRNRSGNALALSLLVLLVATLLANALLSGSGHGSFLAVKRLHRMQAQSLAEGAIELEAWRLSTPPRDSAKNELLRPPAGLVVPTILVDSSDFWLRIESTADFLGESAKTVVELGRPRNKGAFEYALRVLDPMDQTSLSQLRVKGPLLSAGIPVTPASVQIMNQSMQVLETKWMYWVNLHRTLFQPDSLEKCGESCVRGNQRIWGENSLLQEDTVRVERGDLRIDLSGKYNSKFRLPGSHLFVVQGNIELEGSIDADTLVLISEGDVLIRGSITAKRLTIFSMGRIQIEGEHRFEVRLFAQGNILLSGESTYLPWSFVATSHPTTRPESGKGDILFQDDTRFTGYVFSSIPTAEILVETDAKILGAVISPGGIRNEGLVGGITVVRRLSCQYKTGTNCPGNGVFNRDSLPSGMLQLPGMSFGEPLHFASLRWRTE